jgi:hypothetical protein
VQFKFTTKVLNLIGLSGGFTGNWQTKKSRYVLTFLQKIMTFAPDYFLRNPDEVQADAVSVFLNSGFTPANVDTLVNDGVWGPNNPPVFIG